MQDLINKIKMKFLEEKQGIYEAISKDFKKNNIQIEFNRFMEIIDKLEYKEEKGDNLNKTIAVIYNGNPYVTFELSIYAILKHQNIILISENIMGNLNKEIIQIIQNIITQNNENIVLRFYNSADMQKLLDCDDLIDKILFLGDKRIFRSLRTQTNIPIYYNGFGSIIIYTDDEDKFEEEIYTIKDYALENNIEVNMYIEDFRYDIERINMDGKNDICILFSDDENKIETFRKEVNSNHILINSTEIQNFTLELDEEI